MVIPQAQRCDFMVVYTEEDSKGSPLFKILQRAVQMIIVPERYASLKGKSRPLFIRLAPARLLYHRCRSDCNHNI